MPDVVWWQMLQILMWNFGLSFLILTKFLWYCVMFYQKLVLLKGVNCVLWNVRHTVACVCVFSRIVSLLIGWNFCGWHIVVCVLVGNNHWLTEMKNVTEKLQFSLCFSAQKTRQQRCLSLVKLVLLELRNWLPLSPPLSLCGMSGHGLQCNLTPSS